MAKVFSPLLLILAIAVMLGGCTTTGSTLPAGLNIEEAWARPSSKMPAGGMDVMEMLTSAVYLTIRNGGPADKLTAAESDIAKLVEIHQTTMDNGNAKMTKVSAVEIPENGTVELKPGGYHIMLIQPVRELQSGDTFNVTLIFEKAGRRQIPIIVKTAS